jgi:hypothetical protein
MDRIGNANAAPWLHTKEKTLVRIEHYVMLLRLACGKGEKLSFVYKLFPVRWGIALAILFFFLVIAERDFEKIHSSFNKIFERE